MLKLIDTPGHIIKELLLCGHAGHSGKNRRIVVRYTFAEPERAGPYLLRVVEWPKHSRMQSLDVPCVEVLVRDEIGCRGRRLPKKRGYIQYGRVSMLQPTSKVALGEVEEI